MIERDQRLYFALLIPASLLLLFFIVVPIGESIFLSFHRLIIGLPQLQNPFVGLDNYRELLLDPVARHSF
ncbi:MAG: sugar ABC transporter permease, partial [Deltaproteobacteria bacterium]